MKRIIIICIVFFLIIGDVNAQKRSKHFEKGLELYDEGNYYKASKEFEAAYKKTHEITALYNAGIAAQLFKDYERASVFFRKCIDSQYYENGKVYSNLADCYVNTNDLSQARNILEEGLNIYPQSTDILIGLINLYIELDSYPDRLFSLIRQAQANDPTNASLYYVEGNAYCKIGDYDKAIATYEKSSEIDPTYEFGFIGIGVLYYNIALDLQKRAEREGEDSRYNIIKDEFTATIKLAIEPFEKAFNISANKNIKLNVAEYLVNIYNYLKNIDIQYFDDYKKYAKIIENK